MKTNFIIFTLLQLRDTRTVNCVRNTARRRRKQTQNCAAVPCLSTRAVVIKHVSHRNLSCLPQRGLRYLRLNVRPALYCPLTRVQRLDSKEHVDKVYVICHGLQHLQVFHVVTKR